MPGNRPGVTPIYGIGRSVGEEASVKSPDLGYLAVHNRQFWTSDVLASDCSLGESVADWAELSRAACCAA
jgi:hypothetical protein